VGEQALVRKLCSFHHSVLANAGTHTSVGGTLFIPIPTSKWAGGSSAQLSAVGASVGLAFRPGKPCKQRARQHILQAACRRLRTTRIVFSQPFLTSKRTSPPMPARQVVALQSTTSFWEVHSSSCIPRCGEVPPLHHPSCDSMYSSSEAAFPKAK